MRNETWKVRRGHVRIHSAFFNFFFFYARTNVRFRTKLEYNSLVSVAIYLKYQIQCLDNVQNRFQNTLYRPLLNMFDVVGLSERRKINYIKFLFNLTNGYIDCPELLSFLNFYAPQFGSRSSPTLYAFNRKTNYASASPINRLMLNYFNYYTLIRTII